MLHAADMILFCSTRSCNNLKTEDCWFELACTLRLIPGELCKSCSETGRRAFPNLKREGLVNKLSSDLNFRANEFAECRLAA